VKISGILPLHDMAFAGFYRQYVNVKERARLYIAKGFRDHGQHSVHHADQPPAIF